MNPAAIVSDLIKKNQLLRNKSVYLIGSEGLRSELKKAGVDCFGSGPDPMHDKDFDDDVFLDKNGFLYSERSVNFSLEDLFVAECALVIYLPAVSSQL